METVRREWKWRRQMKEIRKKLAKDEITNLKILNGHILFEMTGDFKLQVAYNCFTVILFIRYIYSLIWCFFIFFYLKYQESD